MAILAPKTYPLKIPMNHPLAMDVNQSPGNISQLGKLFDRTGT